MSSTFLADSGPFSGKTVDGYTLGDLLGRGGEGDVYKATKGPPENVQVALKVLHPHVSADPQKLKRVKRGLDIASEAKHDYVLSVPAKLGSC